jgi:hypothetical protein
MRFETNVPGMSQIASLCYRRFLFSLASGRKIASLAYKRGIGRAQETYVVRPSLQENVGARSRRLQVQSSPVAFRFETRSGESASNNKNGRVFRTECVAAFVNATSPDRQLHWHDQAESDGAHLHRAGGSHRRLVSSNSQTSHGPQVLARRRSPRRCAGHTQNQ